MNERTNMLLLMALSSALEAAQTISLTSLNLDERRREEENKKFRTDNT